MEEAHKFFQTSFSPSDNTTPSNVDTPTDHFIVEDLFDFSNDDTTIVDPIFDSLPANSSAASSHLDTSNTTHHDSNFITDGHFSGDLPVPYDDLAELEWVSKFTDESFSNEDVQNIQLTSDVKVVNEESLSSEDTRNMQMISGKEVTDKSFSSENIEKMQLNEELFSSEEMQMVSCLNDDYVQKVQMMSSVNDATTYEETNPIQVVVPAKTRSKRSRGPSGKWNSQLLVLSPTATTIVASPKKHVPRRRDSSSDGCGGRKCLHCATDKTPQWRTGPLGPKTLCNACGVRFKSGRLVPEYRPAASPTFTQTKHSNSHRKVLELRRQKEMNRAQQQQVLPLQHRQMMFDQIPSNNDDYLIQKHMGTDFRHLL